MEDCNPSARALNIKFEVNIKFDIEGFAIVEQMLAITASGYNEQEIIDAMMLTWQRMKIVMEPSSAVPLATIIKNKELFAGKRVGVIITGGNVDLNKLPWNIA